MSSHDVHLHRDGGIAIITLDAPARRNALTAEMGRQLLAVCEAIDVDESVGAIVIRGEGGYFCSGGDVSMLSHVGEDPAEAERYATMTTVYEVFQRIAQLEAPTIAAIRGGAVGAGLNLALATDIRVVGSDATLSAGFLRIGVHPGGGGITLLHRLVGREAAAAMTLFGQSISGARAGKIGLAWAAPPDSEVESVALALAADAATDPELARMATHSFRSETEFPMSLAVALNYERASQMWSLRRRGARDSGAIS